MLTKKLPYADKTTAMGIVNAISRGVLPKLTSITMGPDEELIWGLCEDCWSFEPRERPTASGVNSDLIRFGAVRITFYLGPSIIRTHEDE